MYNYIHLDYDDTKLRSEIDYDNWGWDRFLSHTIINMPEDDFHPIIMEDPLIYICELIHVGSCMWIWEGKSGLYSIHRCDL